MYNEALGKQTIVQDAWKKIVPAPIHYIRLKIIVKEILLYFRLFSLLLLLQFPLFARFRCIFFIDEEPHVWLTEEARHESQERKREEERRRKNKARERKHE